jgi:Raf kinase inhibitor-like YbhB/YbcL family protein
LELISPAFEDEGKIPKLYTCRGKEISPPLEWKDPPEEVESFALIMEDLDTPIGVLTHWVLYNIPKDRRKIKEDIPQKKHLHDGIIQGRNGLRRNRYLGPCPPRGSHRYVFTLYALDCKLDGNPKVNKKKLFKMMDGHVLEEVKITGHYSKK